MMLILNNEDVARVLSIDDCLEVLEQTFRDYAQGRAVNRPRSHSYAPIPGAERQWYMFKTMDAIVPRQEIGGIRLTSDIVRERVFEGRLRREKPGLAPGGRWTELVYAGHPHLNTRRLPRGSSAPTLPKPGGLRYHR